MPGPPRKPADRRQRRNENIALVLPTAGGEAAKVVPLRIPEARKVWLKTTQQQWEVFWTSPLAQVVEAHNDRPAVDRLFCLRDERERAYNAFRKQRLVLGSQGQKVINPLGRLIAVLDSEIRQIEDRFGLSTRSRLQLGIAYGEAAKSLESMNRALDEDDDDDQEAGDPREILPGGKRARGKGQG